MKENAQRWMVWGALATILIVAAGLRLYRLTILPPGPYYDEAANCILTGEIAAGRYLPLFITSYTGKEVLYFYLAALMMKLVGVSLLGLRLTSALIGVASVGVCYWLAWELFESQERTMRQITALAAAALMAVNFWHMAISRYGFRAISQPLLQGLMLIFLWRGLRRSSGWNMALGGLFCGLTAYTYLSGRIVPLALLPWLIGAWIAQRGQRRRTLGQMVVFGLVAAVVFAPLGLYFLRHPDAFGSRIGQVSLLNPELNQGDVRSALWRSIGAAFGMFVWRGDPQWRFGVVGRPVFDPLIGLLGGLGVLTALYRAIWSKQGIHRVLYASLLCWVPVLLIPSVLAIREVPHSLRAIGVMPVLFLFPSLGISEIVCQVMRHRPSWRSLAAAPTAAVIAGLLLIEGGLPASYDYFVKWGQHPQPYYENDTDMADAARTLNDMHISKDKMIWVSSEHYRHPTMAFLSRDYERIRWLVGNHVLALPPDDGDGAIYAFPRSAMPDPALLDLLELAATRKRYLGPDGGTAFVIYDLPARVQPLLAAQQTVAAQFGGQIELLGYDLPPTTAGQSVRVTLYWRVLARPPADDHLVFIHLRDAWGLHWAGSDPFDYPSSEWTPGQIIVQQRDIPLSPFAPPGNYELVVGVASRSQNVRLPRLDAQGRVAGTTITLGPAVVYPASAPAQAPQVQTPVQARFGSLRLLGLNHDLTTLRQGDILYMGLFWQADASLPDLDVSLTLEPVGGGDSLLLSRNRPVHGAWPTDRWATGSVVLDRYNVTIPHDAPAGAYTLTLTVFEHAGQPVGRPTSLLTVQVQAVDRRTIVPSISHPRSDYLGQQVEFLGYDLDRQQVRPGEPLHLTLYWRALAPMETNYTVFTHLLDQNEQIRGQQDNPPMQGRYPTTLWMVGEVVVDEYVLVVDPLAQPGEHVIEIGMYAPETGQRLPILDAGGGVMGDRILVATMQVQ